MPRYVIHVGPHRTGTTYLQHAFTQLRPVLAARGVHYPDDWGSQHGHFGLTQRLDKHDPSLDAVFDRLNASGHGTILLSTETFAFLGDAGIARLHNLVRDNPAIIVFYARRWSELVPSTWHENVKHGARLDLPEFAARFLLEPEAVSQVNFALVLDRYAAAFGRDSLRLVSYSNLVDSGTDLFAHFCRSFLAWPDPPASGIGRINESMDMVDCEIVRALNALEANRAGEHGDRLFKRYMAAKGELPTYWLVGQSMRFTVDNVRINDASPGLARLHAIIARRFRPAQVPPFTDGMLFTPRAIETPYVRLDYLTRPGILEMLRVMQHRLRAIPEIE